MKHLTTLRYVDAVAKSGSIRKAAEMLAITSTALNRRILALQEELCVPVFERLPRGVRLSSAGEILIHHIRHQISDMERVRSQIADLSGVRRGHVSIACSQALLPYFLPEQISLYRKSHPGVTFGVYLRDRAAAEKALVDHTADLALVFEPVTFADFHTILTARQYVHGVMSADHPLASSETLRLKECMLYPVAMPTRSYGVRHILETAVMNSSLYLDPVVESDSFEFLRNHAPAEGLISFQIPIGLPENGVIPDLVTRQVDPRDAPPGLIYMGQLRGRTLPVAVARFADQVAKVLQARYGE